METFEIPLRRKSIEDGGGLSEVEVAAMIDVYRTYLGITLPSQPGAGPGCDRCGDENAYLTRGVCNRCYQAAARKRWPGN